MIELDVCNWALLKLGQLPMDSMNDGSLKSRYCGILLSPIQNSFLRMHPWNFATRKDILAPQVDDRFTGTSYLLPKKCIRVLKSSPGGVLRDGLITVSNKTTSNMMIEYIYKAPIDECDSLFLEMLALKLASELCPSLNSDDQLRAYLKSESDRVLTLAIDADGKEIPEQEEYS